MLVDGNLPSSIFITMNKNVGPVIENKPTPHVTLLSWTFDKEKI